MLPNYDDNPRAYYDALKQLTPEQLCFEWQEITQESTNYLLECVPPTRYKNGAFLVGECMTHTQHGAIYEAVCTVNGKHYSRPAYLHTFNPAVFVNEIKAKYGE